LYDVSCARTPCAELSPLSPFAHQDPRRCFSACCSLVVAMADDRAQLTIRLGTFNFGIDQQMLTGKSFTNKHRTNFQRVVQRATSEGHFDCFFGCEVGGHMQGFNAAGLSVQDMLHPLLPGSQCCSDQNYLSSWNIARAAQPGAPTLSLHSEPHVHRLSSDILEPQLVVSVFDVLQQQHAGYLLVGNLHIRTPQHQKNPTIATKQRMVREAMRELESYERNGAFQPAALVLLGDCNLSPDFATECTQIAAGTPDVFTAWHVQHSSAGLGGDVLFVKGASTEAIDVPIGVSY
jgi:hypothetical protein